MINNINIKKEEFNIIKPFPYYYQDNYLDISFATNIQNEILNINKNEFDRYSNPFESKNTLRDKNNMPKYLNELFTYWTSDIFIKQLSDIAGYNLFLDNEKNFWGVHTYENNDKLDIHMDAGLHPNNKMKKQITIGLYLSLNYSDKNGCNFEVWNGSDIGENNPQLYNKIDSITPLFNRFIMFLCNDYAWHGNPEPLIGDNSCKRIFITISYLSKNYSDKNKRVKAFFIKRPEDTDDPEKDKLRILRSDPLRYNEVYRL